MMRVCRNLVLVFVFGVAACGGGETASTTSTSATPTSTAAVSTTVSAVTTTVLTTTVATTTTTSATTTTTAAQASFEVNAGGPMIGFPGSAGADGSGCVNDGATLGDGVWFGFATAVADNVITFDLACWFSFGNALDEAAADGAEVFYFPYDDIAANYIRNPDATTYSVPMAAELVVWALTSPDGDEYSGGSSVWPLPSNFPSSSVLDCPGESCAVWLAVNGGFMTGISEVYTP